MSSTNFTDQKIKAAPSIQSTSNAKKINASLKEKAFHEVITEKLQQQSPTNDAINTLEYKPKQNQESKKIALVEEESLVLVDMLKTENLAQPVELFAVPNMVMPEQPMASLSIVDQEDSTAIIIDDKPVIGETKATITTTNIMPKTLDPVLMTLDQEIMLNNIKNQEVIKEFALEKAAMESNVKQEKSLDMTLDTTLEKLAQLSDFTKKMNVYVEVDSQVKSLPQDDIAVIVKQALIATNTQLADSSSQGQAVLSKMHLSDAQDDNVKITQAFTNELMFKNEQMSSNFNGDNNLNTKNSKFNFAASGGIIENESEAFFQMSFKENVIASLKGEVIPKPAMQVSLSVIEALNSSVTSGKKTIIINLFPQSLGPVKVELLSIAGKDGVQQIETIKFIADKRETLSILEAAKEKFVDLTTKATNVKEETSLEFEMNQGDRGQKAQYFANTEEKNLWMNQFSDLTIEDHAMKIDLEANNIEDIGYINEDSVNIKV